MRAIFFPFPTFHSHNPLKSETYHKIVQIARNHSDHRADGNKALMCRLMVIVKLMLSITI